MILPLNLETDSNFMEETAEVIKKFGVIDILINNGGLSSRALVKESTIDIDKKLMNINYFGTISLTKAVLPGMIKRKSGSIINIGSIFGHVSKSQRSSYSATKAGLEGFTKAASLDLAKYGILVNSVCPGFVKTDLTKKILGLNKIKQLEKEIPLGRLSSSEEIVNLIIFLSSNKNTYVTGQSFIIDGGFIVK